MSYHIKALNDYQYQIINEQNEVVAVIINDVATNSTEVRLRKLTHIIYIVNCNRAAFSVKLNCDESHDRVVIDTPFDQSYTYYV